jgi:alkylhydroperoxidase family enzyme
VLGQLAARAASFVTHTTPPRVFTELGRHPRLFRAWLPFAGTLLLGGELPRADTELVILRTARNCACEYEWAQHIGLATRAGLDAAHIEAVPDGAAAGVWTSRQRTLLTAVDELHADRTVAPHTREALEAILTERQTIEVYLLVGHYEMLAMFLNARRVEPDAPAASFRDVEGADHIKTG